MKTERLRASKRRFVQSLVMSLVILMNGPVAYSATDTLPKIRVGVAESKFADTYQLAAVFELEAPKYFHAQHLEFAVGSISTSQEGEAFVSLGPVWRLPAANDNLYFDFGFSPTIISGSTFNDRDVGGHFHFTSSLAVGAQVGRRKTGSIVLRIQHTSNGGLNGANPGLDMVGLEISFGISR